MARAHHCAVRALLRQISHSRNFCLWLASMGKETERGWEQSEDISTLLPSLMRYQDRCVAEERLRQRLLRIPLDVLERETGLSRHSIIRARAGKRLHPRTLELLNGRLCFGRLPTRAKL